MHWEFQSSILTNSRKKNVIHQWMLDTLQSTLDIESVCLGKLSYSPKLKIMFGHLRDVSSMLEHVKKWHVFQDWKIPRKKNICIYNIIYIMLDLDFRGQCHEGLVSRYWWNLLFNMLKQTRITTLKSDCRCHPKVINPKINHAYPLVIYHSYGKWPIYIHL